MEGLGSPRNLMSAQTGGSSCGWRPISRISEQQSSTALGAAESFHQWQEEPRKPLRSDEMFKHSILHGCCVAR
jgi:hypothetical protein